MEQAYNFSALTFAIVSFLGGCLFALCNYKYLYINKIKNFFYSITPEVDDLKRKNPFCEMEVRFLIDLLDEKTITVTDLNNLLKINGKSFQNQRQRRHIFMKEINLKLGLIYGKNETIIRKESEEDKRVKVYAFFDGIDTSEIEKIVP